MRGVTISLNYANNGRVSSLVVDNTLAVSIFAQAKLTDGRTFGQDYPPGSTSTNFPNNVVSVSFDAQGEFTLTGIASISTSIVG